MHIIYYTCATHSIYILFTTYTVCTIFLHMQLLFIHYTIHTMHDIYLSFLYDIVQSVVSVDVKLFKQSGVLVENRLIIYLYMFIYGITLCIT